MPSYGQWQQAPFFLRAVLQFCSILHSSSCLCVEWKPESIRQARSLGIYSLFVFENFAVFRHSHYIPEPNRPRMQKHQQNEIAPLRSRLLQQSAVRSAGQFPGSHQVILFLQPQIPFFLISRSSCLISLSSIST